MSEPGSMSATIAARYAQALYEIADAEGRIDALEQDVERLRQTLDESDALRQMIRSPLYDRDQKSAAIAALAEPMGLSDTTAKTLRLMAGKGRLFALPDFVEALRDMIADHRGEVTAEVRTARPLDDEQAGRLAETLGKQVGKNVKIQTTVDESLIGGLVVKVGSRMIDTSISAKLANLRNAMKEVG